MMTKEMLIRFFAGFAVLVSLKTQAQTQTSHEDLKKPAFGENRNCTIQIVSWSHDGAYQETCHDQDSNYEYYRYPLFDYLAQDLAACRNGALTWLGNEYESVSIGTCRPRTVKYTFFAVDGSQITNWVKIEKQ